MIRTFGGVTGITNQPQGLDVGLGAGSPTKSIQSGVGSIAAGSLTSTAAISAVDLTKSVVRIIGGGGNGITNIADEWVRVVLTSATQITFTREGSGGTPAFSWEVIEFNTVKSVQKGQSAVNASSESVPISQVNRQKSLAFCSASTANTLTSHVDLYYRLIDDLTLQLMTNGVGIFRTVEWQVVELP